MARPIFDSRDYEQNHLTAAIGYLIFFVPLLANGKSALNRFCANQGALGWIAYLERPEGNVMGHTGFTGTSIWMDMATGDYLIFLTNRVHPTRDNEYPIPIRRAAFKVAFDAEL